jgi:hypothetical protein
MATPVGGSHITPTWTYTWAFGDAGFGTGSVVAHTYLTVGQYAAVLTATHLTGLVQDTTIVIVYQPYPLYLPLVFWNQ